MQGDNFNAANHGLNLNPLEGLPYPIFICYCYLTGANSSASALIISRSFVSKQQGLG